MKNKIYFFLMTFLLLLAGYLGLVYLYLQNNNLATNKDLSVINDNKVEEEKKEEESIVVPPEDSYEEVVITAAGDIMTHIPLIRSNYNQEVGGYDFTSPFRYIKVLNENADLKIANLETVTRGDREISGFPNFNAPYEIIYGARYGGFNVLSTANNHCYDQGKQGLLDTISRIEEAGLDYIGTNKGPIEKRYRMYNVKGIKIGLLCYSYGLNGHIAEDDYSANIIDLEKIKEDINNLKAENADKIVMFIHWGVEYNTGIYDELRNLGYQILDLGVDYILGSHPHVVMPVEKVGDDKFIVYSMGNLLSNQRKEFTKNANTEDGLFVRFKLVKNISKNETNFENLELIPFWINRYYNNKWNYEILPVDMALNEELEGLVLDDRIREELTNSKSRVESILNK